MKIGVSIVSINHPSVVLFNFILHIGNTSVVVIQTSDMGVVLVP
jgi:hypothetical protein